MPRHDEARHAPARTAGPSRGGQDDLTGIVDDALRRALAWRGKGDVVEHAKKSFVAEVVDGRTELVYAPHRADARLDGTVDVKGPQASLAAAVRDAVRTARSVVDQLQPLGPSDDEDVQATTHLVLTLLEELADELGRPARPRSTRVDKLFEVLLGQAAGEADPEDPDQVGGQLGRLRDQLRLRTLSTSGDRRPNRATLPSEEESITAFLRLCDLVVPLRRRWNLYRGWLSESGGGPVRFMSPHLDVLRRRCDVVEDSTRALEEAFDADGVRAPRRDVTPVRGTDLTVQDLLDWVEHFAGEEVMRDVEAAGRAGVGAYLLPTAAALVALTDQLAHELVDAGERLQRCAAQLRDAVVVLHDALAVLTSPAPVPRARPRPRSSSQPTTGDVPAGPTTTSS